MERFLPLWVLVAPRNPNPQASLRISLLDEERLLQLSQPGVSHLAQPGASLLAFALFMGISMSITAFPVLVRILQDRGIFKTSLGSTATACRRDGRCDCMENAGLRSGYRAGNLVLGKHERWLEREPSHCLKLFERV